MDDDPTRPARGEQPAPGGQPRDPRFDAETTQFQRPEPDQTSILPPTPGGRPTAGDRPTTGDRPTAIQPGAATGDPGGARWSGRAGVPTGGPPRGPVPPQEQQWVPAQQPRTWWAPILIIVAIVVLLALIGLGLWLATRGQPAPTPSQTPSPSASSASPSASPSPSPSPSAASSPPAATVTVPSVTGVMLTDAEQILQSQNLKWKVVTEVSDQPAGSVIRTDPPAGSAVPAGSTVTLYVATPPATSASPSASPSASAAR